MTIDEAVIYLEVQRDSIKSLPEEFCLPYKINLAKALDVAIEALKEKKKAENNEPLTKEDLRPHGKWIGIGYEGYAGGNPVYDYWKCSECGNEEDGEDVPEQNPYCRSCGAKMDK